MLRELLNWATKRELVELITPRRTFADVILPEKTRRQLYEALMQIEKHRLIFNQWGLGERHATGTGLAFNFAGPPGTGKTICAEAVARALGKKLYRVRYAEMESCWAGETGKNVVAVFRDARQSDSVLFFDEADSIASRRFTGMNWGYEREANHTINILLKELEDYEGVVIFATNLASNFDPAFERRIRTHVLFEMPGPEEREKIWRVQFHPVKTPLAEDVDFHALAEAYPIAGGDIKNAVLKAAQMAAAEEGADEQKRIAQRHLVAATEQVREAKRVMSQNLFGENGFLPSGADELISPIETRLEKLEGDTHLSREELSVMETSIELLREHAGREAAALREQLARDVETLREQAAQEAQSLQEKTSQELQAARSATAQNLQAARAETSQELRAAREQAAHDMENVRGELAALRSEWRAWADSQPSTWETRIGRLERGTFVPLPRWASLGLFSLLLGLAYWLGMLFHG